MKTRTLSFMAVIAIVLSFVLSVGAFGTHDLSLARAEETQSFLTETAVAGDYSQNSADICWQGENGMYVRGGSYTGTYLLRDENGIWSGNGATVNGARYIPGENGVSLEWRATSATSVRFSGIVYNAYAYEEADMSAYRVPNREQTSLNRDGVTVKVFFYTAANNLTTLYEKTFDSDFALFADGETYAVGEGDRFVITIACNQTTAADDTYIYISATTDSVVAKYDFTKEENYKNGVLDNSGNENGMNFGPNFPSNKEIDSEKGLYFNGFDVSTGSNLSNSFLYNPNYNAVDYTDTLTDFSVKMNFTLDNKSPQVNAEQTYYDRFQYLLSTTSSANCQKGFAVRTESMGDTVDGKTLYAIKLCINDGGDFHFVNGGWITVLAGGESYELILNISSTQKKAELFIFGKYYNESGPIWEGRNRTETIMLADSWTMENSGEYANGLTIGAKDEAGQEGFKGWVKDLTVYDYCQTLTETQATRPSAFGTVSVTSCEAIEGCPYNADESAVLQALNTERTSVTLNTDANTQTTGIVSWKEVIFDGIEYYALGTVKTHGMYNEAVKTVKAKIDAYVAKVMYNGECVNYLTCAKDGNSKFVKPNGIDGITGDYVYTWYADAEKNTAFDFDAAVTADTVIYVDVKNREYTIEYVLDGGTQNEQNITVYTKETGTIYFSDPVKEGYVFDGWYLNDEQKVTFIDSSKAENITLYARWTKAEESPKEDPPQEEPNQGGCASTIGGCWLGAVMMLGAACVLKKKK